jgi:myo-inositol 2-dehydrogenase/D-chiro-inositol 1-dehydrogenase
MARKRKTRVGIIGSGSFGRAAISRLTAMDDVELVGISNRGAVNLKKAGLLVPNVRLYQDSSKLLSNERLDAAVISVPPSEHGVIEELCCEKKVSMFIEKPIGLSADKCRATNEMIKSSGVIVSVDYQERYSQLITLIKGILEKEKTGMVYGSWISSMPDKKWWSDRAQSGGQVVEQATHIIDIYRYLFGEPLSVFSSACCSTGLIEKKYNIDECSSSLFTFPGGITAVLQTGCYTTGINKIGFDFFTNNFHVEFDWGKSVTVTSSSRTEAVQETGDPHTESLKAFINAVRTGDTSEIKSDYDDSLKTLTVSLAVNKSIQDKKLISF